MAQSVYTQENGSLIFVDFHAIRYAPGDPEIVYFACDQGSTVRRTAGAPTSGSTRGSTPPSSTAAFRSPNARRARLHRRRAAGLRRRASSAIKERGEARAGRSCRLGPGGGLLRLRRPAGHRLFHHPQQPHARPLAEGRLQDRRGPVKTLQAGDRSGRRLRSLLHPRRQSVPAQRQLPRQHLLERSPGARAVEAGPPLRRARRGLSFGQGAGALLVGFGAEKRTPRTPAPRTPRPESPGRPPASGGTSTAIRSSPWRWRRRTTTIW